VTLPPERVWRVFPWDPAAHEGEPFSATYVPRGQGKGRFDLPGVGGGVLYCSETPEGAVGEAIQPYRGHVLEAPDLRAGGQVLALVGVILPVEIRGRVVDLCDPQALLRLEIGPDLTASNQRRRTQGIAARLHAKGHAGLRWWSALTGDWHTVVLFRDRLVPPPTYGAPEPLTIAHPVVVEAARTLGIRRAAK
jgi:hypothetical protein